MERKGEGMLAKKIPDTYAPLVVSLLSLNVTVTGQKLSLESLKSILSCDNVMRMVSELKGKEIMWSVLYTLDKFMENSHEEFKKASV